MRETLEADSGIVSVDLVCFGAAVCDDAAEAHLVVPRLGVDCRYDAVHGEDGVKSFAVMMSARLEINVGHGADQPLGPACGRKSDLLPA